MDPRILSRLERITAGVDTAKGHSFPGIVVRLQGYAGYFSERMGSISGV